jgi:hypothetical protein
LGAEGDVYPFTSYSVTVLNFITECEDEKMENQQPTNAHEQSQGYIWTDNTEPIAHTQSDERIVGRPFFGHGFGRPFFGAGSLLPFLFLTPFLYNNYFTTYPYPYPVPYPYPYY